MVFCIPGYPHTEALAKMRGYAMIHITEEHVLEYQALVLARYGQPIDKELAHAELIDLICLLDVVLRQDDTQSESS